MENILEWIFTRGEECKCTLSEGKTMTFHALFISLLNLVKSTQPILRKGRLNLCLCSFHYSGHIPLLVTLSVHHYPVQPVVFPAGHTSPASLDWPLCLHSLRWVPRCSTFKSCCVSSNVYALTATDHPPPCPIREASTPTWSPWPASWWRRAGGRKAQGSWPRCWTRCARRCRPSPALCAKLGSPTCELTTPTQQTTHF